VYLTTEKYINETIRYSFLCAIGEPKDFSEALENANWHKEMDEKYEALMKNKTWYLVPTPPGNKNIIDYKWVYKVKKNSDGTIERYKYLLSRQTFKQRYGNDYEDTFSHVVKSATIHLVLAIAVSRAGILNNLMSRMRSYMAF
jgi:histone deacetylase 1/2